MIVNNTSTDRMSNHHRLTFMPSHHMMAAPLHFVAYTMGDNAVAQRTVQVYTTVVEAIKARVAAGDWAVGQRLPSITQLAQVLGVGTGSVREAVKVLASLGIIRIEHGRGMFVASAQRAQVDPYNHFQDVGTGS